MEIGADETLFPVITDGASNGSGCGLLDAVGDSCLVVKKLWVSVAAVPPRRREARGRGWGRGRGRGRGDGGLSVRTGRLRGAPDGGVLVVRGSGGGCRLGCRW